MQQIAAFGARTKLMYITQNNFYNMVLNPEQLANKQQDTPRAAEMWFRSVCGDDFQDS